MIKAHAENFETWKLTSKKLLAAKVHPENVQWHVYDKNDLLRDQLPMVSKKFVYNVPKSFLEIAKVVALHESDFKWTLLYRVLWRLMYEEKYILSLSIDKEISQLRRMEKEVRLNTHKMEPFFTFPKIETDTDSLISWYEPSDLILKRSPEMSDLTIQS